jgi:hypothetical protein
VSDTPRTDEFFYERARGPGVYAWLKYARTIERELTDSNAELRRLHIVNAELLEALRLALESHGRMLMSDPPQDAWKAYGVEEKARAAIDKAEEVKP